LEITVPGIGAHADEHAADVGLGQHRGGGGLQAGFDVPLNHSISLLQRRYCLAG
jgi:hypothetical protein